MLKTGKTGIDLNTPFHHNFEILQMKNSQISEKKNALFPSDTKLKIRFKRKNLSRETIARKCDIVTIHSRLLYTISRILNTRYCFYRTSRDQKQHHQLCCTIECEGLPGRTPSWKIQYCNLLCIIDLSNKFVE